MRKKIFALAGVLLLVFMCGAWDVFHGGPFLFKNNIKCTKDVTVGDDLTVTDQFNTADATTSDDLVVGDDASVAGDLTVTGSTYGVPFVIAIHHEGQETATVDPIATFQMPMKATATEVSVCARDIDTVDTDETYTVDIEEAGTSILSSAISITADNTCVVGTISDSALADNAKIEVVLTLGGTTPTIDDLTILMMMEQAS